MKKQNGVLEYWSIGVVRSKFHHSITPSLHHSLVL